MTKKAPPTKGKNAKKRVSTRVTLAQVAAKSGVAVSTVSHILNGRESCYASKETRDRVAKSARELGYRPNLAARALRGGATYTLGIVTTALDVEVCALKCMKFEQMARDNGYLAIMSFNPNNPETEDRLIMWLRDRSVDGIAVCPSETGDHEELKTLAREGFPVVTFDGAGILDFDIDDVSVDYRHGGKLQAEHLLEIDRRKACIANSAFSCFVVDERIESFSETMVDAGCDEPVRMNLKSEPNLPSSQLGVAMYEQLQSFLKQNRGKFDCLMASGDQYALSAIRAAFSLGIRVPEELAIVSFDGTVGALNTPIQLSSVQHPCKEVGEAAFGLLSERMQQQRKETRRLMIKPELIVRGSSVASV